MKSGDEELLPPPPIVRRDQSGNLVAIDGHNLLACRAYFNQAQHVHIATSADDKLTETSEADILRNKDLKDKFETSITERDTASENGIRSFDDLIEKYSELFESYR